MGDPWTDLEFEDVKPITLEEAMAGATDDAPVERPCWKCTDLTPRVNARTTWPECYRCRYRDDARPDDQVTSRAAARSTQRGVRSELALRIRDELRRRGHQGATDDELSAMWPDDHPGSLSRRRDDLVQGGLAIDSGRTRATRRGRQAIVFVASEFHSFGGGEAE